MIFLFLELRQSFGLYRPVGDGQVVEISPEVNNESMSESGEDIHPHYNPMLFCDGGVYLDPDIIDLTLIPPPETPDRDTLTDFPMNMPSPPAGFQDEEEYQSLSDECLTPIVGEDQRITERILPPDLADLPDSIRDRIDMLISEEQDLGSQLEAFEALLLGNEEKDDVESETDSGNETISSETVNGHSDVEEFIASMAVPLPPRVPPQTPTNGTEDDFLQLVIPPPPTPVSPATPVSNSKFQSRTPAPMTSRPTSKSTLPMKNGQESRTFTRRPKLPPPPPPRRSSLTSSSCTSPEVPSDLWLSDTFKILNPDTLLSDLQNSLSRTGRTESPSDLPLLNPSRTARTELPSELPLSSRTGRTESQTDPPLTSSRTSQRNESHYDLPPSLNTLPRSSPRQSVLSERPSLHSSISQTSTRTLSDSGSDSVFQNDLQTDCSLQNNWQEDPVSPDILLQSILKTDQPSTSNHKIS